MDEAKSERDSRGEIVSGFTKLVPEIVQSSLWNESAEIRCVWIAMIATKDENGYVRGDARTIARVANVSQESTTLALAMFQEPDPSSHTPDNEGRRIIPAPGGWIVLNHGIYRVRDDVYREKGRLRVEKFRNKMEGGQGDVTLQETLQKRNHSASASVSASGFSFTKEGSEEGISEGFDLFWEAYPKKTGKKAALKAWVNAKDKPAIKEILSAIDLQRGSSQWIKDGGQYIPNPATWINQGRWMDKPTNTTVKSKPVVARVKTFDEWVTDLCSELNAVNQAQWDSIIARYPYSGYKSATSGKSVKDDAVEIMMARIGK